MKIAAFLIPCIAFVSAGTFSYDANAIAIGGVFPTQTNTDGNLTGTFECAIDFANRYVMFNSTLVANIRNSNVSSPSAVATEFASPMYPAVVSGLSYAENMDMNSLLKPANTALFGLGEGANSALDE